MRLHYGGIFSGHFICVCDCLLPLIDGLEFGMFSVFFEVAEVNESFLEVFVFDDVFEGVFDFGLMENFELVVE